MQHTQLNVVLLALALLAVPALAGTIAHSSVPDPLLDGGDTPACAARTDYAAGTDATGRPVVPADAGAAPVPVLDQIAVPLHGRTGRQGRFQGPQGGDSAYVGLDGRKLAPLLNPMPCR